MPASFIHPSIHPDPSDASVPHPSIRSTSSLTSLSTPATQQNGDSVAPEANEGEEDLGADESAFDEEGIIFGDSKLGLCLSVDVVLILSGSSPGGKLFTILYVYHAQFVQRGL